MKSIPNLLTVFRALSTLILVVLYYLQQQNGYIWANTAMVAVFILASISDYLDGYLARKMQISSKLGAFLDPIADKLIVIVALVLLVDYYHNFLILLPILIIIMREVIVLGLREWMGKLGHSVGIAVSFVAKIKTGIQLVAIIFLLDNQNLLGFSSYKVGVLLLYIAALLTLYSGWIYWLRTRKTFDT